MLTSSRPIPARAGEESDRYVLRNTRSPNTEGPCSVGETLEVRMEYECHTDLMHVDVCSPQTGARIDVIDVGEQLGFPGQILARVDLENRVIYGVTIQRFSTFKRKLMWKYRMASIRRAMLFLLNTLRAGLWIDHNNRAAHLPAVAR